MASSEDAPPAPVANKHKRKSLFGGFDTSEDDDDGFVPLPVQSPKRQQIFNLTDMHDNVEKVRALDDNDPVHEAPEIGEADPAYYLNHAETERYLRRLEVGIDQEATYNRFRLAEQAYRQSKHSGDPKRDHVNKQVLVYKDAEGVLPEHVVDADEDLLVYLPCKPPSTTDVDAVLGDGEGPSAFCFGCTHGVGFPQMNGELVEQFEAYIRQVLPHKRDLIAAVMIAHFYEVNIRAVVNLKLEPDDRPLPEWTPRQVYDCLRSHKLNSSLWLLNQVRNLEEHAEILREGGLYVVERSVLASGRRPTRRDLRVNPKYHKMYMETLRMATALRSRDPTKMFGHNEKLSLASTAGSIVAPKKNLYSSVKITSYYQKT
jgi:hypothetical protein